MNDDERDLRELFETKAREAGAPSPVAPEVLRRGRRRQVGTVAIGALTALAVTAAAVMSLQTLTRADTDSVPGGVDGNPSFTATIANLTLTVPEGWTLVDQWPLAALSPVGAVEHFSCTGTAVEVGSDGGQNPASTPSREDCTQTGTQTAELPSVSEAQLPLLTLSNRDPGLAAPACDPRGDLPADTVTLYVGINAAVMQLPDWQSQYPSDRGSMVTVLLHDGLADYEMPCGPGGYEWFQSGGLPYIAWADFGEDASEADRQAVLAAFDGMQVSGGDPSSPVGETPGYVIAGGIRDDGPDWTLEAHPSDVNVDLSYHEAGDSSVSGAKDFTVPAIDMELSRGGDIVFGAVRSEAESIELRPADGSAPVSGSILQLPPSLGAPFDAFVVSGRVDGEIVATGPDGVVASRMIGGEPSEPPTTEPSIEDRRVQADLRNAFVAAKTYYTDEHTYEGFTPEVAASIERSLAYNTDLAAVAGEISIRDVASDQIVLVELSASGTALCIAELDGSTTYGAVDAQSAAECVGGEFAWGQDAMPTVSPVGPPTSVPANSVAVGQNAGVSWSLGADGDRLVLTDADGAQLAHATTRPEGAASMSAHSFGEGNEAWTLVFGVVTDPDAIYGVTYGQNDLRVGGPGDSSFADDVQGEFDATIAGPIDGVAIFTSLVPGDGEGTVTFIAGSRQCRVLARFLYNGSGATPAPSAPDDEQCSTFSSLTP